ncbi:MAG: hypothetical protein IPO41_11330 [Acidobacteria bacterium]|nr:hypothetical protein [Acidobacteriota bacterium]
MMIGVQASMAVERGQLFDTLEREEPVDEFYMQTGYTVFADTLAADD